MKIKLFQSIPKIPSFKKAISKNIGPILLGTLIALSIVTTQIYNLNKKTINNNYIDLINNTYFQKTINHGLNNLSPKFKNIEHKILPGESFAKILKIYEIPELEINKVNKALSKKNNLNKLKTNQILKFTIDQSKNNQVVSFLYPLSRTKRIQLSRDLETNEFKLKEVLTNLNKKFVFKEGKILQSLYKTAMDLNIKPNVIVNFARIYGFQVDFQRDIKRNDSFQIIYEIFEDDNNKIIETGNIIFADLNLSGQPNPLYYFGKKDSIGHYDVNGKSAKKALMKTPINGARLSSPFGMRKHPIDGFNKMHRGTDFAAKEGTPVMASGDGIVVRAKWCGGGGNCIKIKHNSTYQTIYAHLKNFASGIRSGVRVKQGQVIGYVGSTGKSTGPHLHYEVIEGGKKINSQTLKLPSGKILKGKDRELFEVVKIKTDVFKSELILGIQ